jgi:hypothetical protein
VWFETAAGRCEQEGENCNGGCRKMLHNFI